MFYLTKVFRVACGHRLHKHKGLCKNLHGHNLKIEVTVARDSLNENDMVIDFSDLKAEVNNILDGWDHAFFVNAKEEPSEILAHLERCGVRMISFAEDPTSEILCVYLFSQLKEPLRKKHGVDVISVAIWESDDSKTTFTGLM